MVSKTKYKTKIILRKVHFIYFDHNLHTGPCGKYLSVVKNKNKQI